VKDGAIDALAPVDVVTIEVIASVAVRAAARIHDLTVKDMVRDPLRADAIAQCVSSLRRKSTNRDVLLGY
jgi:hypothetical protein